MFLDESLEFADAVSVGTPNASTVNVGDVVDLGAVVRDIGNGRPLYFCVKVSTAITSGGAATVRFRLSSDSTSTPAVNGTQSEHIITATVAVASLVAGYGVAVALPQTSPDYERYLGFQVEAVAAVALNGGTVDAFLTFDPPANWVSYADGVN